MRRSGICTVAEIRDLLPGRAGANVRGSLPRGGSGRTDTGRSLPQDGSGNETVGTGRRLRAIVQDESGNEAIEFALVAPVFLVFLFGIVEFGTLAFTQASLHYAVEKYARCAAVDGRDLPVEDRCGTAKTAFYAPGTAPTFTTAAQTCGIAVTASVTYSLKVLDIKKSIPLSASACFPDIRSTAS